MNLSYFVASIVLTFSGSFGVDDTRDIASYQFDSKFDNYSASFDIYYSFGGSPSNAPSIQISTQTGVLISHQMTSNDFYSGSPNSALAWGNIYKYSFTINSVQHTNIYYFKVVNDNDSYIPYMGNHIDFFINATIYDFPVLDGSIAYDEGYSVGYDEGYEIGVETGKTVRDLEYQQTQSFFDQVWDFIETTTEKTLAIFNINILPGIPLYFLIVIPIALGLVGWIFKLLQR